MGLSFRKAASYGPTNRVSATRILHGEQVAIVYLAALRDLAELFVGGWSDDLTRPVPLKHGPCRGMLFLSIVWQRKAVRATGT